jgi:hypothetical protein
MCRREPLGAFTSRYPIVVIPAKAGIQSGEVALRIWMPAFAGMTVVDGVGT